MYHDKRSAVLSLGPETTLEEWVNEQNRLASERAERLSAATESSQPGTCSSNTYLQTRQSASESELLSSVPASLSPSVLSGLSASCGPSVHIDELQIGAVVSWSDQFKERWQACELARLDAQEKHCEVAFPFIPGLPDATISGMGGGSGHESYCRFTLRCGPAGCIVVHFDARKSDSRQLYNFRMRLTGTACLLVGVKHAYAQACKVVRWLGGEFADRWVKMGHICLELPGVSVDEFAALLEQGKFSTTAKRWTVHDGVDGKTGFTIGQTSSRLRLNVYDKLADIAKNHDAVYEQAYIDRRCGGVRPAAATRIEYQAGKEWLDDFKLDTVDAWFQQLPAIVQKLTAAGENAAYAFFRLLEEVPDKKNRNQSRVKTAAIWQRVVDLFREHVGAPEKPLARIQRGLIRVENAAKTMAAYGLSIAAQRGQFVENVDDLCDVLREAWSSLVGVSETYLRDKWEKYARRAGTLQEVHSFDPKQYDPGGEIWQKAGLLFDPCVGSLQRSYG